MNFGADSALVGGPRYGAAQSAQAAPDCDARVTLLCKQSATALDSEGASLRLLFTSLS